MTAESKQDRVISGLLWAGVAAVGQFTALFLSIVGRIHVRFENEAPLFQVDPRGPIVLTKDSALRAVGLLTVLYAVLVFTIVCWRPVLGKRGLVLWAGMAIVCGTIAGLAEPVWGLTLALGLLLLVPLLRHTA
jgi:hypothetical protein